MLRMLTLLLAIACMIAFTGCQKGTEVAQPGSAKSAESEPQLTRAEITMLEVAAAGDTEAVKNLLERGVNVNMRGFDNNTPIMEAAFAGRVETVKLLLDHGADLSARKNDGATVVTLDGGHREIAELFRDVTALVAAAGKGDNNALSDLIQKGTPLNGLDPNGQSALTEACWNGHTQAVRLLLDKGADPNIKKADGETALSLARAQKRQEIVALLETASK